MAFLVQKIIKATKKFQPKFFLKFIFFEGTFPPSIPRQATQFCSSEGTICTVYVKVLRQNVIDRWFFETLNQSGFWCFRFTNKHTISPNIPYHLVPLRGISQVVFLRKILNIFIKIFVFLWELFIIISLFIIINGEIFLSQGPACLAACWSNVWAGDRN